MENPKKCLFTCMAWDDEKKLLFLGDEQGYIHIANVYMGASMTITKKIVATELEASQDETLNAGATSSSVKILDISIHKSGPIGKQQKILLCLTERQILAFEIKMGQQSQDIQGHTDAVIKIISLDPRKIREISRESLNDTPKIITTSLDNTIRLWNSGKMETINVFDAPNQAEISCMTFLLKSCLVATGHEDGSIRLWNLEINSSIELKSLKGGKHTNSISCIISDILRDRQAGAQTGF